MEILNNIWNNISTPNEELVNLLLIIASFIENALLLSIFLLILNISSTKVQKLIYIIVMSTVSLTNIHFIPTPLNLAINYFAMILLTYFLFKTTLLKSCFSSVISIVIFNLIGSLILNPFLYIFNITSDQLKIIPIYRIIYISIIYSIVGIILYIIRHLKFNLSFMDDLDDNTKYVSFANLLLGIVAIIIQSITLSYYVDNLPLLITFLSFISLLAYFFVSFYSLTRIFKLNLTTKKLQSAEEYNNTLHILHDNVRGFKHDFDNIVTTIGGYIRTEDMEGLKNYYLQLEDDCQRVNNLYVLNPAIVNNDGIYNLLTKKYYEADSQDIKVNITFLLDLSKLNMKIYEFARILGILIDNAIEASSECDEKIINLIFRDDSKNSRQLIILENTYNNKNIDTEKIFEKGISGKENHTGLGLWEVRKIIKKTNNVNLYTTKDDKFFKQQLEIYY